MIVIAATDVLYFFKDAVHAQHLVVFYLLPTAFVALLYGSVLSMIVAIDATFLAAFFLCEPSNAMLADPLAKARFIDLGASLLPGSAADFGNLIASETKKWGKVIKFAGIKPE